MNDLDFQFQASCGRYPHTPAKKSRSKASWFKEKVETDGQKLPIAITLPANAICQC